MIFSSITFIYLFLPVSIAVYYLSHSKLQNIILLFFSLTFYAWGEPIYILLLLISILINYFLLFLITELKIFRKTIFYISILFNLVILLNYKYLDFLILSLSNLVFVDLSIEPLNQHLPIGVSFFTFQIISCLVDVYKNNVSFKKNLINFALYVSMFPQLVAGPIVRYHQINEYILKRSHSLSKFSKGVKTFIVGLFKKVFIANNLGVFVDYIYSQDSGVFSSETLILCMAVYTLQIYFDFSGYTDMALGLGKIFGFDLPHNFNEPYKSKSISEFWRRWHISLSNFFKEYVYVPLGGNKLSKLKTYQNLFIVFLFTGLWHGAALTFIFWGFLNFLFIVFEKITNLEEYKRLNFLKRAYFLIAINISWVFFRSENIESAFIYLKNAFNISNFYLYEFPSHLITNEFIVALLIGFMLVNYKVKRIMIISFLNIKNRLLRQTINDSLILLIFFISILKISSDIYAPFIYFRF